MGVLGFLKGRGKEPNYEGSIKKIAVWRKPIEIKTVGGHAQAERAHEMRRTGTISSSLDAQSYVKEKSNQNLLIAGASGQGKSKLMRLMLEMFPNPKTVFSFKKGDEYLQIEGNMIYAEKSLPNPFSDPDAFTSAFAVASSASSEGIQMSIAMSLARRLAAESSSWGEFTANAKKMEKSRDSNSRAASVYILQKTHNFAYNPNQIELDLNATNIIDFSYLNEEAKAFYAELFLRQLYNQIRDKPSAQKAIICVDEAHRLTKNITSKHATIFGEMSKEVRAYGMLWTATQNLTDLIGDVRNNFATQFCFNTTNEEDMRALSSVNRDLARCASTLKKHEFMDAKGAKLQDEIPIFKANVSILKERAIEARAPGGQALTESAGEEGAYKDRPTATIHAGLLAIYYNPKAELAELAKWVSMKKFVNSPSSIYGNKGRKGIFETAVSLGYAREVGKRYELTTSGRKWADPNDIIKEAPNLGSDLHKQLLIKTIEKLHEDNILVFAPNEENTFDLIAYPPDKKKRYLWDDKNGRGYEIQTSARKDSIIENAKKKVKYKIPITWVTYNNGIMEEIKRLTENMDSYMLVTLQE